MNRNLFVGAIAAVAALSSGASFAQSPLAGTYLSIGAGTGHASKGCGAVDVTGNTTRCDKNDTSIKLVGGYKLPGTDFAGELSWVDLGKYDARSSTGGATAKDTYWGIGAAYLPNFGNGWGGVARVGEAYGTSKVNYSLADGDGSHTKHDWHPYYGLGVNYALSRNVKVEADWDITRMTSQLPAFSSSTATVNNYTVGASYAF